MCHIGPPVPTGPYRQGPVKGPQSHGERLDPLLPITTLGCPRSAVYDVSAGHSHDQMGARAALGPFVKGPPVRPDNLTHDVPKVDGFN